MVQTRRPALCLPWSLLALIYQAFRWAEVFSHPVIKGVEEQNPLTPSVTGTESTVNLLFSPTPYYIHKAQLCFYADCF